MIVGGAEMNVSELKHMGYRVVLSDLSLVIGGGRGERHNTDFFNICKIIVHCLVPF